MAQERFNSLHAVRGIAAIVVLTSHLVFAIPGLDLLVWADPNATRHFSWHWKNAITYSPLHVFWSGHEAVLVFFALSGFVLTLAILKSRDSFAAYVAKRIVRIWVPFAIALLLAIAASEALFVLPIGDGYSEWLRHTPPGVISIKSVLGHLLMTGLTQHMTLSPVMWSLVHEIRISIAMPIIVWGILKFPKLMVALALFLLVPGAIWPEAFALTANSVSQSLLQTAIYVPIFIGGAFLAIYRDTLKTTIAKFPTLVVALIWVTGILLLEARWIIHDGLLFSHIASGIGAGLIILMAFASPGSSRFLDRPALSWLGDISYPLYLTHFTVLIAVAKIGTLIGAPVWVVLPAVFVVALLVADIFRRVVDSPVQNLNRMFSAKPQTA
ncbi:acyltransferase [Mesorhizobium sp. PAMC28654]|uniref:acyltransferase family protein n=1 Tax=Mesorhizobium sp. PAMC28654 TaxID=2880934 RepID=UPI001D0B43EC|nr:acyltransferase [Mesorhizobium sp. PAMC28654]UDL92528.1 acyltransferase [Mesorhizobium sp. PAMC28654]